MGKAPAPIIYCRVHISVCRVRSPLCHFHMVDCRVQLSFCLIPDYFSNFKRYLIDNNGIVKIIYREYNGSYTIYKKSPTLNRVRHELLCDFLFSSFAHLLPYGAFCFFAAFNSGNCHANLQFYFIFFIFHCFF